MFPLMEGDELDELVADIRAHGLREPVVMFEGKILDGRNRYRACMEADVDVITKEFDGDEHAARAFVISANLHRRHLTAEDKRKIIAELIKAEPEKSDLQIAKTIKASPTTVGTVRTKMEVTGDVSKLETRRDTMGRSQPTRKPRRSSDDDDVRVAAFFDAVDCVLSLSETVGTDIDSRQRKAALAKLRKAVAALQALAKRIAADHRAEARSGWTR
jgi:ParB-like chromosome segregation protein Spo0J